MPRRLEKPADAARERKVMAQTYRLSVNGVVHSVTVDGDTPLLYVLRNDLGLNGPRFGCGLGQCGACTVLAGDVPVRSCSTSVSAVADVPVVTLEGLGTIEQPHPVQSAFLAEQAAQCGFCSNGMIMMAKSLLDETPHPDAAAVRQALSGNLCRCGTHSRIVKAVLRAAQTMSSGKVSP
jgi:nicotinate dehydrogenase subunit A